MDRYQLVAGTWYRMLAILYPWLPAPALFDMPVTVVVFRVHIGYNTGVNVKALDPAYEVWDLVAA